MTPDGCARVGMIGAGAVAQRHAATLLGFPDAQITAVADVDPQRAEILAARCGARPYATFDAMLARESLDAVYICTPPFARGPPELAAIAAGLAMFVEKPVAIDVATGQAVARAARERGTVAAVGYHWRYLDTVERARDVVRDNAPRLVLGYWLDKTPPAPWWGLRARSGGQIVEQATHVLDLLRFVVGDVSEVCAHGSRIARAQFPDNDIADATAAILRLESGAVGALVSTCLLRTKHRAGLDLFCDGMSLELTETHLVLSDGAGPQVQPAGVMAKTLADRDFIDAVNGAGNRIRAPYDDALETHRLACAIAAAVDDGGAVAIPRAPRRRGARDAAATASARSLGVERPGKAALFDVAVEAPVAGGFRVDTVYSGLSAGTELTFVKGTNPALRSGWDAELGLFLADRPARAYPIETMGYMEVGCVAPPGGCGLAGGRHVAMAYGHKTAHCVDPARDRFVVLPEDLDPLLGIYVAHMGPICANGLLHAAAELIGRDVRTLGDGVRGLDVVVLGAGVVGLLTALFAAHHGAAAVLVVDGGARRRRAARGLGFDVFDPTECDVAREIKARCRHGAADCGADVAFQCRASAESLRDALRSVRPQGVVIDLAFYTAGAEGLCLGEEFHHNGLTLRCAQIARVPRGLAPLWNRNRLSAETIDLLRARGDDIRREVVTDVVELDAAPQLLEDLAARRREAIQVVFELSAP